MGTINKEISNVINAMVWANLEDERHPQRRLRPGRGLICDVSVAAACIPLRSHVMLSIVLAFLLAMNLGLCKHPRASFPPKQIIAIVCVETQAWPIRSCSPAVTRSRGKRRGISTLPNLLLGPNPSNVAANSAIQAFLILLER